jgi:spermidine/putrescine transport system ATP-binding protein
MKGSTVAIENVSKSFGTFRALENAQFTINKGEFFSLLGPSGCGKTTLLRIIAGFELPDTGAVLFDGTDIVPLPPNKRPVNTVFQNYALFPHLTVYENVAFSLRLQQRPVGLAFSRGDRPSKTAVDEKVMDYLNLVQLDSHARKKINQLSGGQRQRVAIARALINEPGVLLLDEPLSALDAKLRSNLLVELDHLHDEIGITFIYVTHDQSEALSVSDRIAVMNKGEILQVGTPWEIYEQPATEFVAEFIGETNTFTARVVECKPYASTATGDQEYMVTLEVPELGAQAEVAGVEPTLNVTDYEETNPGQTVCFTVRPEKIRITGDPPVTKRKDINVYRGVVDEPVYSGFQSKFYVRLDSGVVLRVFKQHSNYLDDGPEITWKDQVYVSWSANDGYIVEDINK